jgi:hypothetical protein
LEHGDKLFLKGNRLMSGYIFLANVSWISKLRSVWKFGLNGEVGSSLSNH